MEIPAVTLWASDDFSVPCLPQLSSVVIIHLLHMVETSTCEKSTWHTQLWTQTCGKGSYTEHHLNSLLPCHQPMTAITAGSHIIYKQPEPRHVVCLSYSSLSPWLEVAMGSWAVSHFNTSKSKPKYQKRTLHKHQIHNTSRWHTVESFRNLSVHLLKRAERSKHEPRFSSL